jgi:hypothetical protein
MIENMYFTGRQAMDRQDWVAAHKSLSIYWWIVQYIYSQSANAEAVQFVHALSDNLAHVEWQMNDAIQSRRSLENQLAACSEALRGATGRGFHIQTVKSSLPAKPPLPARPPVR